MSSCCNVLLFSGLQNGPVIQVLVLYITVGKNKVCKERVLMKLIYGLSAANAFLSYVWTKISFFQFWWCFLDTVIETGPMFYFSLSVPI